MTYSSKQNGPNLDIYRDEVHIATFDPVAEEVTYTDNAYKKFRKPINDHLKKLNSAASEVDPPKEKPVVKQPVVKEAKVEEKKPVGLPPKSSDKPPLSREIMRLKIENAHLKDEVAKLRGDQATSIQKLPERFSDVFDDSEGAHLKGITQGDLTPEYVAWAETNMPKAIFDRRYHGRLRK